MATESDLMLTKLDQLQGNVKRYYRNKESYDWTRAADTFVGLETLFHRYRCKETLKLVNEIEPKGHLLDVGCGTGLITRFLPPGTVALDLNPRNLQKAKQYAGQARFILCDAEGMVPLRDQSLDVAVCTETLEHLIYPSHAVKEIFRVLKPNGFLVGSVPGRSLIWKLRWLSSSKNSFDEEPYHKHYNQEELEELLSEYFSIHRLYSKNFQMSWFFVVVKKANP